MKHYWRCRGQQGGQVCGQLNRGVKQRCTACGKPRPRRSMPTHLRALDIPYETYVELNGGENCGICNGPPKYKGVRGRHDRDHDHKTGRPRGLLCTTCNRRLVDRMTAEWCHAAGAYLERAA